MDDNSVGMDDDDEDRWDDDDARMDDDTDDADDDAQQPMTPLVRAIVDGEPLDAIQDILQRSPELMQQQVSQKYPLSYAVMHGSPVEVVGALYRCWPGSVRAEDHGFDVWLPVHHMCDDTPVETVQFLVDAYPGALRHHGWEIGLPIHASILRRAAMGVVRILAERDPGSLLLGRNTDGSLPIHLAVTVTEANRSSNFELVEYLADRCPGSLLVGREWDGKLPIHIAAATARPNQMRIVQLLYNRCPESLGVASGIGDGGFWDTELLPIHYAAQAVGEQQLEVIEFLASQRPESLLATTSRGYLPVHLALKSRSGVQAGFIQRLTVEPISEETRRGLLHFLLRERLVTIYGTPGWLLENVSVLVDALPETLRAKDSDGALPIHFALQPNERIDPATNLSIVRRLVAPDPGTLLIENAAGDLPLHVCTDMETAAFLYESCPQSALVPGSDGNFPIHSALTHRWFGLVTRIVELYPRESQQVGARRRTPMHFAATVQCCDRNDAHHLLDAAAVLVRNWPESLLDGDADGNVPIHVAIDCLKGDWACEFVRFLIERSPDSLRTAGASGRLPLHVAVSRTNPPPSPALVQLLVDSCDVALVARDASGKVPLLLARANPTAPLDVIYSLVRTRPDLLRSGLS